MSVALAVTAGVQLLTPASFRPIDWCEAMSFDAPGELVWRIENSMGWRTNPSEPTLPRSSTTFALVAQVFASQMLDSCDWYIRAVDASDNGQLPDAVDRLAGFPTATCAYIQSFERAATSNSSEPMRCGLWVLYRDVEPVALFDERAALHTSDHRVGLYDLMSSWGFDLATVAQKCLDISSSK